MSRSEDGESREELLASERRRCEESLRKLETDTVVSCRP